MNRFLIHFFVLFTLVPLGMSCILRSQKKGVETVFLINRYSDGPYYNFAKILLSDYIPTLVRQIVQVFPESRFGFATYGDYSNRYTNTCYTRVSPLTSDIPTFIDTLKSLEISKGGTSPEDSMAAIIRASLESGMDWSESISTSEEKTAKIIILVTDDHSDVRYTSKLTVANFVNDTCAFKPPSYELVGQVLQENDIFLMSIVSGPKVQIWLSDLKKLQEYGIEGAVLPLDITNTQLVFDMLMDDIERAICEDPTTTSMLPTKPEQDISSSTFPIVGRFRTQISVTTTMQHQNNGKLFLLKSTTPFTVAPTTDITLLTSMALNSTTTTTPSDANHVVVMIGAAAGSVAALGLGGLAFRNWRAIREWMSKPELNIFDETFPDAPPNPPIRETMVMLETM